MAGRRRKNRLNPNDWKRVVRGPSAVVGVGREARLSDTVMVFDNDSTTYTDSFATGLRVATEEIVSLMRARAREYGPPVEAMLRLADEIEQQGKRTS